MSNTRTPTAGVELSLRIGQRVRHEHDYKGQRVTGLVRGLSVDAGGEALMVDVLLDAPIIIPAAHGFPESHIHHQHVPAHELTPFDGRDELIDEMLAALKAVAAFIEGKPDAVEPFGIVRAAIAAAQEEQT